MELQTNGLLAGGFRGTTGTALRAEGPGARLGRTRPRGARANAWTAQQPRRGAWRSAWRFHVTWNDAPHSMGMRATSCSRSHGWAWAPLA